MRLDRGTGRDRGSSEGSRSQRRCPSFSVRRVMVASGSRNARIGPDRRMCSEFSDSARRAASAEVRFVRGAQGISRSGPELGSDRDLVPLTLLGIRPGSARGAGRDPGRLLGVAADWLRRSDPTDGPCSGFPAVLARSRPSSRLKMSDPDTAMPEAPSNLPAARR